MRVSERQKERGGERERERERESGCEKERECGCVGVCVSSVRVSVRKRGIEREEKV